MLSVLRSSGSFNTQSSLQDNALTTLPEGIFEGLELLWL